MKPGFYENMPANEYFAIDAANASTIKQKTAAHMFNYINTPIEASDAMNLGTGIHSVTLQLEKALEELAIMPDLTEGILLKSGKPPKDPKRTDEYKERKATFLAANQDKTVLTDVQYAVCNKVREYIEGHSMAGKVISELESIESAGVWEDPETGVLCKARFDGLLKDRGACFDLKTTKNASHGSFMRAVADYGYDVQVGHYLNGLDVLFPNTYTDFIFVAAETEAPYGVQVFSLSPHSIEAGRAKARRQLRKYAEAKQSGVWKGYSEEVVNLELPGWRFSEEEREGEYSNGY